MILFPEMWSGNNFMIFGCRTAAGFLRRASEWVTVHFTHVIGQRWTWQCTDLEFLIWISKGTFSIISKLRSKKNIVGIWFWSLCSLDSISFGFCLPPFKDAPTWNCEVHLLPLWLGTETKRAMVFSENPWLYYCGAICSYFHITWS